MRSINGPTDVATVRESLSELHADVTAESASALSAADIAGRAASAEQRLNELDGTLKQITDTLNAAGKKSRKLDAELSLLIPSNVDNVSIGTRQKFFQAFVRAKGERSHEEGEWEVIQQRLPLLARIEAVTRQWLNALENSQVLAVLEGTNSARARVPAPGRAGADYRQTTAA